MINAITEEDIEETGVVVENPVIGHIPSRQEIVNELEELLMFLFWERKWECEKTKLRFFALLFITRFKKNTFTK